MTQPITIFILSGSLPNLLLYSKILPIISSPCISKVILFRRERWLDFPKTEYVLLPKFISKLKPIRPIFEFLQVIFYYFKYKPQIVNGIYTIPHGFMSLITAKLFGIFNISSIIGEEEELKRSGYKFAGLYKAINRLVFNSSTILTTKGEKTTDYLVKLGIDKDKIIVFNGAIDTNKFCAKERLRDIDILFVGKFIPRKGADRFINIIEKLKNSFPEIQCCMIGDGPMYSYIKEDAARKGLLKNLLFTGYIDNPEEYYQRAKVLIMPSRGEGLSTAMVEAMSCGCVPVVSDVGNMTEAAIHNLNSMVVKDYRDIETFSCYTFELLNDPAKLSLLRSNAINTASQNYSVEKQTDVFNHILEQIKIS